MAFRTWGKVLLAALGAGAVAGAGQLGIAYGFGIVRFARAFDAAAVNQWNAQLAWVGWFTMVATVAGALVASRLARRYDHRPTLGTRLALAGCAALGAATVAPLSMQPARAAELTPVDPVLATGLTAGIGVLVGLAAAVGVLYRSPYGWNIAVLTGAVWALALVSVLPSLGPTDPLPLVRLGAPDPAWLDPATAQRLAVVTMPALALIAGAIGGGLARWRGHPTPVVATAGAVGPALLALAYLTAGPGESIDRYQVAPYWGALVAVAAGALGSVLAAVMRWPLTSELSTERTAAHRTAAERTAADPTPTAAGTGARHLADPIGATGRPDLTAPDRRSDPDTSAPAAASATSTTDDRKADADVDHTADAPAGQPADHTTDAPAGHTGSGTGPSPDRWGTPSVGPSSPDRAKPTSFTRIASALSGRSGAMPSIRRRSGRVDSRVIPTPRRPTETEAMTTLPGDPSPLGGLSSRADTGPAVGRRTDSDWDAFAAAERAPGTADRAGVGAWPDPRPRRPERTAPIPVVPAPIPVVPAPVPVVPASIPVVPAPVPAPAAEPTPAGGTTEPATSPTTESRDGTADGKPGRVRRGLFRRNRPGGPAPGDGDGTTGEAGSEPEPADGRGTRESRGRGRAERPVPAKDEEYVDWVSGLSAPAPTDEARRTDGEPRRSLRSPGRHHAD